MHAIIRLRNLVLRLPDILEHHGQSLNLLSKLVMSLILEKHLVVLEYFLVSLKSLIDFILFIFELLITLDIQESTM